MRILPISIPGNTVSSGCDGASDEPPLGPPGRVLPRRSFDDRGAQQQGNVGREDELKVVALEAGGATMKKRCLDRGGRQAQAWRACLVGPPSGVVVERPELAQPWVLGVVAVQVGTVEWPAGVADPGPDLDVDRVHRAGRPGLVTGGHPVPGRPAERPQPRPMDLALVAEARGTR